jgi:hypothetical protein
MVKLSTMQIGRLAIVRGETEAAEERNREAARRGKFRRSLVGKVAAPDRTYYGLEKRGLVEKDATVPGVPVGQFLWTVTEAGRQALDDRTA